MNRVICTCCGKDITYSEKKYLSDGRDLVPFCPRCFEKRVKRDKEERKEK